MVGARDRALPWPMRQLRSRSHSPWSFCFRGPPTPASWSCARKQPRWRQRRARGARRASSVRPSVRSLGVLEEWTPTSSGEDDGRGCGLRCAHLFGRDAAVSPSRSSCDILRHILHTRPARLTHFKPSSASSLAKVSNTRNRRCSGRSLQLLGSLLLMTSSEKAGTRKLPLRDTSLALVERFAAETLAISLAPETATAARMPPPRPLMLCVLPPTLSRRGPLERRKGPTRRPQHGGAARAREDGEVPPPTRPERGRPSTCAPPFGLYKVLALPPSKALFA